MALTFSTQSGIISQLLFKAQINSNFVLCYYQFYSLVLYIISEDFPKGHLISSILKIGYCAKERLNFSYFHFLMPTQLGRYIQQTTTFTIILTIYKRSCSRNPQDIKPIEPKLNGRNILNKHRASTFQKRYMRLTLKVSC